MDEENGPYSLVESLYGPGTVIAWLLAILSVLLSWTLNKHSRHKDTISLDFIAVLIFPTTAAGHFVYQINSLTVPVVQLMTSTQLVDVQRTAALEAPLNVCESFSIAALILVLPCLCGPTKWKRFFAVLIVGLLSWATENVLFASATAKGMKASETMLSRPYAFLFTSIIASTWAFLGICVIVAMGTWMLAILPRRRHSSPPRDMTRHVISMERVHNHTNPRLQGSFIDDQMLKKFEVLTREAQSESLQMKLLAATTMFYLPGGFISTLMSTTLFETNVEKSVPIPRKRSHFIFLPQSQESILKLDQALALVTGVAVFMYSASSAYKSWKEHAPERRRPIIRRNSV